MPNPPSFQPRHHHKRPRADGARRVGQSHAASSGSLSQARRPARPRSPQPSEQRSSHQAQGADASPQQASPRRRSAFSEQPQNEPTPAPSYPPHSHAEGAPPAYAPRSSTPSPATPAHSAPPVRPPQRRRTIHGGRIVGYLLLVLLALLIAWIAYLYWHGTSLLGRTDSLASSDTPGDTYLIVGSDERDAAVLDPTEGQRADTIMLLHQPESGAPALVSLPRDTLVNYPDSDSSGKLNGAFSYGGPEYLVQTVEELTGIGVDHYIQIGMNGVKTLTDAVGGVELCLDMDVSDEFSGLEWTAGCHESDGTTALAFSRMRYSDPLGDIGRTQRQRQVVGKIIDKALSPSTVVNPFQHKRLVDAGAGALSVDPDTSLIDIARAGLALRTVMGPDGLMGAPPIASLNYPGPNGSSTVLLADSAADFFAALANGTLTKDSFAAV